MHEISSVTGSSGNGSRSFSIIAAVPVGVADQQRLEYVLKCLLCPVGLAPELHGGSDLPDCLKLSWERGGGDGYVPVSLLRMREAFELISGVREVEARRDHLGRVNSTALGVGCSRPMLSEWGWQLAWELSALNAAWKPPQKELTVHLTHDVDRVHPLEPMGLAGRAVRAALGASRGRLHPTREMIRWLASASGFVRTYSRIMEMEHQVGAVATYFFMSGPYSFRRYGSRAGQSRRLKNLLGMVWRYGHRAGLHGCVYSLARGNYGIQRVSLSRLLGRQVRWHRGHYLVWDARRSPPALAEAGIRTDSTCGFHDANGFRAGLAWPYELWDLDADAPAGVTEIPLVFMDGACGESDEEEWMQLYERLEAAADAGGEVAILLHVDRFVGNDESLLRYKDLLQWLKARGVNLVGDVPDEYEAFLSKV